MKNFIMIELRAMWKALLFSVILCLLVGTVINLTSLNETLLAPLGKIIFLLTILTGALLSSRSYGSKGLIRGINMGLLFFILAFVLTMIIKSINISLLSILWTLVQCILAGAIGGIVGISLSK